MSAFAAPLKRSSQALSPPSPRRSTACTSCRSRRDTDRSAQLWKYFSVVALCRASEVSSVQYSFVQGFDQPDEPEQSVVLPRKRTLLRLDFDFNRADGIVPAAPVGNHQNTGHLESTTFTYAHAVPTETQTRAARFSACSCSTLARNLHSTTIAEKSSMALSPPKASSAGLRARQAAKRETTASTLIHAIVRVCTLQIRWKVSGEAIWGTDAIRALWHRTPTPRQQESPSNDG